MYRTATGARLLLTALRTRFCWLRSIWADGGDAGGLVERVRRLRPGRGTLFRRPLREAFVQFFDVREMDFGIALPKRKPKSRFFMRSINSPSSLSPLEQRIVAMLPTAAKHVAVIGAGDGRLARAVKEKLGTEAHFLVIEPRQALHRYLEDFEGVSSDPWDLGAYESVVRKHGAFDFVVFYGLHEYWRGYLHRFQKILAMTVSDAPVWVTFANLSALHYFEKELPPLQLSADALASPMRQWARLDYASWVAFAPMVNARVEAVWGLFDAQSFQFYEHGGAGTPVSWNLKGIRIEARSPAEVVHWGASYVGIEMKVRPRSEAPVASQVLSGAAFHPHLFQALVDPFPEARHDEDDTAWAAAELAAVEVGRAEIRPSQIVEFILGLIENPESVKDVLVVGAGWGRDIMMIKTARPQWNVVGADPSAAMVEIGASFRAKEQLRVEHFTLGSKLPFADKSFDVVISLGIVSRIYNAAALELVKEILRVARKGVYHLEDSRGIEHSFKLKQTSLGEIYALNGKLAEPRSLIIQGQSTGFIFTKVAI